MELSKITDYEELSLRQWMAFGNKAGGIETVIGVLQGKKTLRVENVINLLFDRHGRRIPRGLKARFCDADPNFRFNNPVLAGEVDYNIRHSLLHQILGFETGISVAQFQIETERLLNVINDNPETANLTKGVFLPVILPKLMTDDLGAELERYLAVFANYYNGRFDDRKFCNLHEGSREGRVNIAAGSRYGELIRRIKIRPVIGIYFPCALQGFSVHACCEQMETLPHGFILSGLDIVIAMIMYYDILAFDAKVPGLDLTALSHDTPNYTFGFLYKHNTLSFFMRGALANAYGFYSGGLLFIG